MTQLQEICPKIDGNTTKNVNESSNNPLPHELQLLKLSYVKFMWSWKETVSLWSFWTSRDMKLMIQFSRNQEIRLDPLVKLHDPVPRKYWHLDPSYVERKKKSTDNLYRFMDNNPQWQQLERTSKKAKKSTTKIDSRKNTSMRMSSKELNVYIIYVSWLEQ